MASNPIDQGAILRSGALLIPNLAEQYIQQDQVDVQRQQVGLQQQKFAFEQQEAQREQQQAYSYAADIQAIQSLPVNQQPQAIAALMQKYPKQSEALKRSYDAQDAAVRDADTREAGELFSLVQNGAADKAAARLRKRIEADRAAGQDTSDDEAIADDLESGEPARVQSATAQIGMMLSLAAGPDKFASTYSAVKPDVTNTEQVAQYIERTEGAEAAKLYRQSIFDPLATVPLPGGRTYVGPRSGLGGVGQAGGGGDYRTPGIGDGVAEQRTGGKPKPVANAQAVARELFPNIAVTQNRRDPNSALGKANPNSWHNRTGAAIDVKPIPGMTFSDYVKRYKDAGYTILESKNEVGKGRSRHATGDHWHIVLGEQGAAKGVPRVTSKAQFDKLPSGAEFTAPDGTRRRKP